MSISVESNLSHKDLRSYILSYGTYLPTKRISTKTLVEAIQDNKLSQIAKATGIKHRRVGHNSSSIELARKAVDKCLSRTQVLSSEIDLIIGCNIGKINNGGKNADFEPSEAAIIASDLGLRDVLCFDINNACAGMMTGIYFANHLLQQNLCRLALVVSGEYISHMAFTAAQEIKSAHDSKFACLTLGDAGAAVLLAATSDNELGFRYVDLQSYPQYSDLCYAKPSGASHGGMIMETDSKQMLISGTRLTRQALIKAHRFKNINWSSKSWVIPHQISDFAMQCCDSAVRHAIKEENIRSNPVLSNIREVGNTASTTHILALAGSIASGKIKDFEHVVFAVQASGLIIGLLEYQMDDLPTRIRRQKRTLPTKEKIISISPNINQPTLRNFAKSVCIQGFGIDDDQIHSVKMASSAARKCLSSAKVNLDEVGLLIHTSTMTTDWIEEPASSAMIAGELGLRRGDRPEDFLSLDIRNGKIGFFNAIFLACSHLDQNRCKNVLITQSMDASHAKLDTSSCSRIGPGGSALLLATSTSLDKGFCNFFFRSYGNYLNKRKVSINLATGTPNLSVFEDQGYEESIIDCIYDSLLDYLQQCNATLDDFDWIVLPQGTEEMLDRIGTKIQADPAKIVRSNDTRSSSNRSICIPLKMCLQSEKSRPGDRILIVEVASGIQVGITQYRA